MNRIFLAVAALAMSCGDVKQRDDCRTSATCPLGEYCAHTEEGSVCWPDAVAPAVSGVTVTCGTPGWTAGCPRDGTLVVTATATDDKEVYAVDATLALASGETFPLARASGDTWTGTIDLAKVAFPVFKAAAVVTVRVRDGARNEVSAVADAEQRPVVTRVRWAYSGGAPLSPPAVADDGTVVVARAALSDQLLAVNPDATEAWSLSLGGGAVTVAPSIGAQAIWVAGNDGKLHAVELDGSAEITERTCPPATGGGTAKGPPAILTTGGVDVAFGAFSNGRIYASGPTCVPTLATDSSTTGAALAANGGVIGVTGSGLAATLHRYNWDGATFAAGWDLEIGGEVVAPIAFGADGAVLTGGKDKKVVATTTAGVTVPLATLNGSIDESPIVLNGGDLVVGDASGRLHRLRADGTAVWSLPVNLGAAVQAPMALTGDRLLVATSDGVVHALGGDGTILWAGALSDGMLGAGNIHGPDARGFSTAYFSGADGKLYAVIVEGALDTSAPWPKAWHDPRNTSRAGGGF